MYAWHDETNEDSEYEFSKVDNGTHSPIIGFAFDGYPIYGSYGHVDGNVTLMRSNYILKENSGMGYNGIDDYEYSRITEDILMHVMEDLALLRIP